jgi:hypothetical protein
MTGFPKNYFDDVDNIIQTAKNSEKACDKHGILRELSYADAADIEHGEASAELIEISTMNFMLLNAASVLLQRKPLGIASDDRHKVNRFVDLVERINARHVTVNFCEGESTVHTFVYMFVPDGVPDCGDMPVFI